MSNFRIPIYRVPLKSWEMHAVSASVGSINYALDCDSVADADYGPVILRRTSESF